jgi:hypothetical protein
MCRRTKGDKKNKKKTFVGFVGCEGFCMEDVVPTVMLVSDPLMLDCDAAVLGQQWELIGSNGTPGAVFQLKGASEMCVGLLDCASGYFEMVPCTDPTTQLTNPLTELTLGGSAFLNLGCWKQGMSIYAIPDYSNCDQIQATGDVYVNHGEVLFLKRSSAFSHMIPMVV